MTIHMLYIDLAMAIKILAAGWIRMVAFFSFRMDLDSPNMPQIPGVLEAFSGTPQKIRSYRFRLI